MLSFDRLSAGEQRALAAVSKEPDAYGILRPRHDRRLTIKSVSRDTAQLLDSLRAPSTLPKHVVDSLADRCDTVIAQMVLDGILEIEANGEMISGSAAQAFLFGYDSVPEVSGSLAALSRRALEYAERLEVLDVPTLSMRLYAYNCAPLSLRWKRIFADEPAVLDYLGIDGTPREMREDWLRIPPDPRFGSWIAWMRRGAIFDPTHSTYKLYVSPACSEIRDAFKAVSEVVARSRAVHVKIGSDAYGLLRPDKIVIHFHDAADTHATAEALAAKLEGCAPQGVPFTAESGLNGLLSWGVDPPMNERSNPWVERESWRGRICTRLASALVTAKASPAKASAVEFALQRLRLDGIDTATWTLTA